MIGIPGADIHMDISVQENAQTKTILLKKLKGFSLSGFLTNSSTIMKRDGRLTLGLVCTVV